MRNYLLAERTGQMRRAAGCGGMVSKTLRGATFSWDLQREKLNIDCDTRYYSNMLPSLPRLYMIPDGIIGGRTLYYHRRNGL